MINITPAKIPHGAKTVGNRALGMSEHIRLNNPGRVKASLSSSSRFPCSSNRPPVSDLESFYILQHIFHSSNIGPSNFLLPMMYFSIIFLIISSQSSYFNIWGSIRLFSSFFYGSHHSLLFWLVPYIVLRTFLLKIAWLKTFFVKSQVSPPYINTCLINVLYSLMSRHI